MPCISLEQQEKEEKLHLIQLDWSSRSDDWKIEWSQFALGDDKFFDALYGFAMEDKSGFRRFLEDNYKVEDKYIESKREE